MKVFILIEYHYNSESTFSLEMKYIIGVYSSLELATNQMKISQSIKTSTFEIEECTLDELMP